MYVDYSFSPPLVKTFKQRTGGFIPGYTGHCPTLKFRFGQCYGANTKEIMQELTDKRVIKGVAREPYIRGESRRPPIVPPTSQGQLRENGAREVVQHRSRRYILGYTGYIPGLSFRYGKSYVRAADDCMAEFGTRLVEQRRRFETERRARSAPQMNPIRNRDEVSKTMTEHIKKTTTKFRDHHLSPNSPPIAGYTGHIPRMANGESSLSQRFECAARKSLAHLERDRKQRWQMQDAEKKVEMTLAELKQRRND